MKALVIQYHENDYYDSCNYGVRDVLVCDNDFDDHKLWREFHDLFFSEKISSKLLDERRKIQDALSCNKGTTVAKKNERAQLLLQHEEINYEISSEETKLVERRNKILLDKFGTYDEDKAFCVWLRISKDFRRVDFKSRTR